MIFALALRYTLALPMELMAKIWPEYPDIKRPVEEWDQEFQRALACRIAQKVNGLGQHWLCQARISRECASAPHQRCACAQVSIKRVTTKFDGERCTAYLGFKHGLFGPVIESTVLFKDEVSRDANCCKCVSLRQLNNIQLIAGGEEAAQIRSSSVRVQERAQRHPRGAHEGPVGARLELA